MAEQSSAGDGFESLWPTVFLRRTLPGHELANQALAAYILDLDRKNRDMTTDYLGGNLMTGEHPAVAWLRECVNRTVADYFSHLGMG